MNNDLTIQNAGVHSTIKIEQKKADLQKNKEKLIDYIKEKSSRSFIHTKLK